MSYLQMLQQARQQDADANARLWGALGNAALSAVDMKLKADERAKTQAQEQAKLFQQMGGVMLQANQGKQAAELLPKFREAVKTGYGVDLPNTSVVGEPITALPQGPVPLGAPAMAPVEIARDFSGEQTLNAIRGGLMLEPPRAPKPDLFRASPYENVIDQTTGKVVIPAQAKPVMEPPPKMGWVGNVYQELKPGVTRPTPVRQAAPRASRAPRDDSGRLVARWQENRFRYIEDYVKSRARQLPATTDPVTQQTTPTLPTKQQEDAWRAEAARRHDEAIPRPGGAQAPAGQKPVRTSALMDFYARYGIEGTDDA